MDKKIAACVQILGPIASTYWWKGTVETAEEWLCLIKSKKSFYFKIEKAVKKIHTYETPEIIAVPIINGSKEYFKWLDDAGFSDIKVEKLSDPAWQIIIACKRSSLK